MIFDIWNKSERGNQNTEPSSCGFIFKNLGPKNTVLMFTCIRKKCSTEESKTLIFTKVKTSYENVTTMTAKRFIIDLCFLDIHFGDWGNPVYIAVQIDFRLSPRPNPNVSVHNSPLMHRVREESPALSTLFGCVRISIRVRIRRSVRWLVRP